MRVHPTVAAPAGDAPAAGLRQRRGADAPPITGAPRQTSAPAAGIRSTRVRAIDFRTPRPIPAGIFVKSEANSSGYTRDLRAASHRQTPGSRSVSMFWQEKIDVVLSVLQIMGLLWLSGSAWPDSFRFITQFAPALNGDVLSVLEYNANEENGLPRDWDARAQSFAVLVLPSWCILPLVVSCVRWCCSRCHCCACSPQTATSKTLWVEEFVYLPVLLSCLHMLTCRGAVPIHAWAFPEDALACWCWWDNNAGSRVDVNYWSWSSWVLLCVTVLGCIVAAEFLPGFPVYF